MIEHRRISDLPKERILIRIDEFLRFILFVQYKTNINKNCYIYRIEYPNGSIDKNIS